MIGPDIPPCTDWLNNTHCFECRSGRVLYSSLKIGHRICAQCNAVQDFLLTCPHPRCAAAEGVPSWRFLKKPKDLLDYHWFCSKEHAMDLFSVPPTYVYGDSQAETRFVYAEQTVPYSMTVGEYVEQSVKQFGGGAKGNFVMCIDSQRVPGNQINHALDSELLFHALARHSRPASAQIIIIITQSEYTAQMTLGGFLGRPTAPTAQGTFQLTKGTHAQVVRWLKTEHGLSGTSLTEAGTDGPRTTKMPEGPFAVVTFLNEEEQLSTLLSGGFPPAFVCPFVLRGKHIVIVIPCKWPAECDAIHDAISNAWKLHDTDAYVKAILQSLVPVDSVREEDEEEAAEERHGGQTKRPRTATTAKTKEDLSKLHFTLQTRNKIINQVRSQKPYVMPFCVPGTSKDGLFYVCVPVYANNHVLVDQLSPQYVTSPCFLDYRLVMVPCATRELQLEALERISTYGDKAILELVPPAVHESFDAFQDLFIENEIL